MTCHFCSETIQPGDVNMHHPVYKSNGGQDVQPSHVACHRAFHTGQGDFKYWGRIGGLITATTGRWAFNLKGVRDNPAYADTRAYYIALYAH